MDQVRLIIVEDEPAILQGIAMLVGRIGLPVEIVGTYQKGQDALEELDQVKPDIVMTDVQMPIMSGLELIDQMKKRGCSAEFLILSSYAEFEYVQQAIKLDVRNYLLKPPMVSELKETLEAACSKIQKKRYDEFGNILYNLIFQQYQIEETVLNPEKKEYSVYFYLLGPYMEWGMEGMDFRPSEWDCASVLEQIRQETGKDCRKIWVLNGRYPNLKVLISMEDNSCGAEIYQALKKQANTFGLPITLIIAQKRKELHCLHEEVKKGMSCLKQKVQFGISQMYLMGEHEKITEKDIFPKEEREKVYQAVSLNRADQVVRQYRSLGEKWKKENFSQASCVQTTRYILSMITRKISDAQETDIEADALGQINVISAQAENVMDFVEKICRLIEEIYASMTVVDSDKQVEKVAELLWENIHQHFTEEIDVNEFARNYGYHHVYLITQFSKIKGISPTKLIIQLKMNMAKQLLKNTDMTLKNIGIAVGYNEVSYFSRTFKEHEGISPSAFRKQN
ncbi:MAG: response regulator [Candidatus Limivivens sp.]|nr:response regulator [Candidatus Limivivens sp.]